MIAILKGIKWNPNVILIAENVNIISLTILEKQEKITFKFRLIQSEWLSSKAHPTTNDGKSISVCKN